MDLILFYFFEQMEQRLETEEQLAALYRQRDIEQEYYEASRQHLEQMKKIHQEYTARIRALHVAVREPEYQDKVKLLLEDSQKKIEKSRQSVYSMHPVINALLCVKQELAESKGITMEIHCIHSAVIGIADIEICSILGNLLDNAIEACEKLENANRRIVADIYEKAGFLIIKISNSITEDTPGIKQVGFTSKLDRENHGLGLQMVERICSKHEGNLVISPSSDTMEVSAILRQNITVHK